MPDEDTEPNATQKANGNGHHAPLRNLALRTIPLLVLSLILPVTILSSALRPQASPGSAARPVLAGVGQSLQRSQDNTFHPADCGKKTLQSYNEQWDTCIWTAGLECIHRDQQLIAMVQTSLTAQDCRATKKTAAQPQASKHDIQDELGLQCQSHMRHRPGSHEVGQQHAPNSHTRPTADDAASTQLNQERECQVAQQKLQTGSQHPSRRVTNTN